MNNLILEAFYFVFIYRTNHGITHFFELVGAKAPLYFFYGFANLMGQKPAKNGGHIAFLSFKGP